MIPAQTVVLAAPAAFLGVPIDRAFVTDDLGAAVKVGPAAGSDHRPIIIRLRTRTASGD